MSKNKQEVNLTDLVGQLTKLTELINSIKSPGQKTSKPKVEKVAKPPIAPDTVAEFEKWFFTVPEDQLYNVKRGQWECRLGDKELGTANVLLFHSMLTNKIKNASDVIGIRPIGAKLGIFNGSRITYGTSWSAQKQPQAIAEAAGAVPVPFENVVDKENGAGLDLSKLTIMEWTGAETMIIPPIRRTKDWSGSFYVVDRHFAGAMVIKIEDKYFLFDADREELANHGFNPFFTQLPGPARTVNEAYLLLMPEPVHEATRNCMNVVRQGEFFFVEADQDEIEKAILAKAKGPKLVRKFFYDQLVDRIKLYGASQVNCYRYMQGTYVGDFIGKCKTLNGGMLPESKNNIKAFDSLKDYSHMLMERVGPSKSVPPEKKKNPDGYSDNWNGQQTHLEYIADELQSRLEGSISGEATWDPHTNDARQPSVEGVPIHFRMNIGSQDAGTQRTGRIQNQHQATGVFRKSPKEIYAIGSVFHRGREHRPIYLDKWYRVYPNTATTSWTVSGDVD